MNKKLLKSLLIIIIMVGAMAVLIIKKNLPSYPEIVLDHPVLISTLKSKDGNILGNVYVSYINKNIFSDLIISKEIDGKNAVIYKINSSGFYNILGKDVEFLNEGFYGFEFTLIKDDYFVLHILGDNGKNVSDDINVVWNIDKKIFEVLKTP